MRPIRQRPAWQIKEALRRSGVRQIDIAKVCGVEPSIVSLTINRVRTGGGETKERIWQEIERVTAWLFAEEAPRA